MGGPFGLGLHNACCERNHKPLTCDNSIGWKTHHASIELCTYMGECLEGEGQRKDAPGSHLGSRGQSSKRSCNICCQFQCPLSASASNGKSCRSFLPESPRLPS